MKTKLLCGLFGFMLVLSVNCSQKQKTSDAEAEKAADVIESIAAEAKESNQQDDKGGPIGVKSGIIEYTYSGDKTGKSTQYFDDYGTKSAVYAEIVTQGETSKGWSLTIGEDQYMWDPSKPGEGMKAKNPMVKMMMGKSKEEMEALTASMYEQMGMTKSGTEMFQGKECAVYKGDMGKVFLWNGILMKMEMNLGTIASGQEVTSIKTGIPVDSKYFEIPKNITFREMPGF
ncbi:MAG: hypothetical protein PHH93_14190 [Prolixibacteraceae bacterium]|nr:hypothetical protein [Prolixibacteraceae bacterium]